ncbi:alcohol dehydrogenase catalytic domain-containing protein [Tetragenococcus koreensis]|uniref:zinc-dependent alcohol dehydrogenase n=1 Tax=Tetragenococcus koreensis TaxID=290335 RepID=UPI001F2AEAF4|nr:alcohol dehydrogenase catalytic domain-containing protein [Tetragenococcus koreensis]MDN6640968.1 alcohol dehydrogenase catalytic domain-containing protein [Tetragenococcus sp.]MDN6842266.1 alcohol dehydrogenase catalytic domain-containing protein [Staphylococcus equorum]MCF1585157.1 alcohol dehydrogenase catalytic domain-containing protein [Tetragenococcus koreensis]MCF1614772.1 alcohol dehydrogenase catalytic domain-containing protein [Tetragenococcus koreensis]MCF1624569.1 alcohol dehydr
MKNTCKAAIFAGKEKIEIRNITKPKPKSNEVLVELKMCALCTWEQRVYQGVNKVEFPFIGGHEQAGTIVEVGTDIDKALWNVGDDVAVGLLTSCGECEKCRIGEEGNCENFSYESFVGGLNIRGMGGLSQYLAVSASKIFKIEGSLSYQEAALTEPLSCVVHSVETANIQLGETVIVIGTGIMGAFHAVLAGNKGARVIISEPNKKRIDLMKTLSFEEFIIPDEENAIERSLELTEGKGADVVLNTVGVSKLAEEAIQMSSLYGRVILYSSYHPDTPISISPNSIHKRMTKLMGSANSNTCDFITAMKLLNERVIDVKPFIYGIYELDEIEQAMKTAIDPDNYRVIMQIT